jgi:hypothetical protein
MAMIGFQWMLHKWQLVHSGGLNIFGLDKGVYNLTSVNTNETWYFFSFSLYRNFGQIQQKIANLIKLTQEKQKFPNFFVKQW